VNLVTVAFASNDERGNDTEHAEAVNLVSEEHGNVNLCCQMPRGQVVRLAPGGRWVRVGRRAFTCHGWREWYGNMAWNATGMELPEAERLLRHLLGCGYTVEGYDCDGPFAAIIEKHEAPAASPTTESTERKDHE
jgi:hypothetical protein